ncbi:MAG: hypothetical protein JJ899_10655, partial [Alphaproteobacteria bacterium]|nr:hypothetical protein [Alphaproteobacteria bacterium]
MAPAWDIFAGGAPVPVLDAGECADICARLTALSQHWTPRKALENQEHVFHTLGAATYLDPPAIYAREMARANPFLDANFADLYAKVAAAIEAATGMPARPADGLGHPGFHIFRGEPRVPPGLMFGGTVHMDKPHERHEFPFAIAGTLSLTLPVAIPACGAGMYYWTDVPGDLLTGPKAPHAMSAEQYRWFDTTKQFVGYTSGDMVLHDGLTVHQLANPGPTRADEHRISLQGHGVLGEGV